MSDENSLIAKGYLLVARQIDDSEIAHAAPCTREVWFLALRKANFRNRRCSRTIRRGQWLTTYEEIQELLHWRVGWRKQSYSRSRIEAAMKWLRSRSMITTGKTTRGLFITILNYDFYQRSENYERHTEGRNDDRDNAPGQRSNGGNEMRGTFVPPAPAQVDEYAVSIGYDRPNLGRDFCQHYEQSGWRTKGGKRMTDWHRAVHTWQ